MKAEFTEMINAIGDARLSQLAETLEHTAPEVSIRLNPRKTPSSQVPQEVQSSHTSQNSHTTSPVTWWEGGFYLAERPKFTLDPALHQGRYYVQDASSMILAAVARLLSRDGEPLLWLDACAAPGGKSTAALDGLPDGSLVVSNEYDYSRAEILKENVAKWGVASTVITRGDTSQFRKLPETFDVIAVDAPCSGEGMMRKDQTAREQWSPALVRECADRQREILTNLWPALRPGGYLIYSTCTFNTAENEEMVDWLRTEFGAEPVSDLQSINLSEIDGEVKLEGVAPTYALRFIPGRIRGEGLFLALLRKPGESAPAITTLKSKADKPKKARKGKSDQKSGPTAAMLADCQRWINPEVADRYSLLPTADGGLRIFPNCWLPLLPTFLDKLQVIAAGVEAATIKGKDIIPNQELALTTILSPTAFPMAELSREAALDFLAREAVTLPDGTPRGIVLLTFEGFPLGFVKNIGNRCNNLYPKEWRIKNR
jgi:16S rRNA C967 or C1407 C5-methylase (RsmB/RsmF family)/NOL1/NOP2/fmu family ribosome biogenesis protein